MSHKLEIYGSLCATSTFTVNGIAACSTDFGKQGDESPDSAEPYGCANMKFTPGVWVQDIGTKYGINQTEFDTIASELADKLSFGGCGWCV